MRLRIFNVKIKCETCKILYFRKKIEGRQCNRKYQVNIESRQDVTQSFTDCSEGKILCFLHFGFDCKYQKNGSQARRLNENVAINITQNSANNILPYRIGNENKNNSM